MGLIPLYIITAIFSVAIALLLARLAQLSGQARRRYDRKIKIQSLGTETFHKAVFKELRDINAPDSQRKEIATHVSKIFNSELEKRVAATGQELAKKYETIVEQKDRDEKYAWSRYKKIVAEKKSTDAVIRSIAEGLVVVDAKGKVIMMNPAAEKLIGKSKKEKIGRNLTEDLRSEQFVSLVKGSDDEDKEIELLSQQDETKKVLRASSAVIENENGQTIGMVSVLSDITKQKQLDEMKANFLSNVSHELRTPLVTIEKSIALLLGGSTGAVSDTQKQFLSIAERNLKRLSRLINDLLDLHKLEAGKMRIEPEITSVEHTIKESLTIFDAWAKSKSITLVPHIQPGIPDVEMDPARIIQVLNNLIGNAIKFTPKEGTVTVSASFEAGAKKVTIEIKDTGMGIPQEDLDKIFDKFYQASERGPTDISGTGLGLSIAKEIVELHKGKIWAESSQGTGARFMFTLPLRFSTNTGG